MPRVLYLIATSLGLAILFMLFGCFSQGLLASLALLRRQVGYLVKLISWRCGCIGRGEIVGIVGGEMTLSGYLSAPYVVNTLIIP